MIVLQPFIDSKKSLVRINGSADLIFFFFEIVLEKSWWIHSALGQADQLDFFKILFCRLTTCRAGTKSKIASKSTGTILCTAYL